MSGDSHNLRAESPIPSGRISPSLRVRQQDEDTDLSKKDKGFRRYASAVKTVLATFETSIEEWADYISFLGRLHKVGNILGSKT
jgi:Dopey, N-terminal